MGALMAMRDALRLGRAPSYVAAGSEHPPDLDDGGEVDTLVRAALDELPPEILAALQDIAILVLDDGAAQGAYGLYRRPTTAGDGGAIIVIFRDTLQRDFGHEPELLACEIRRTVRHEVGHHLGFDERGVRSLLL